MEPPEVKGVIFDIQRFCTHDGPGLRTTVFMKGCPLRCLWCDNPESQIMTLEVMYFEDKCTNCGLCLERCPTRAIKMVNEKVKIDRLLCDACGECISVCAPGALKVTGEYMSVSEVVEAVERDYPFYRRSGGGVTLSGGEPLMQPKFAQSILRECQTLGTHTVIETMGYQEWDVLSKVLPFINLVIYDIKHMDSQKHRAFTGVPNKLLLENVIKISRMNIPVLIRIPIIPGYNDSRDNIEATLEFARGIDTLIGVEPLAYHPIGAIKYERLGREYKLKDLQPPSEERMQKLNSMIKGLGLQPPDQYSHAEP